MSILPLFMWVLPWPLLLTKNLKSNGTYMALMVLLFSTIVWESSYNFLWFLSNLKDPRTVFLQSFQTIESLSDTVCELGGTSELANYGEYSGAPSEQQTYDYARTLLSLMTRHPHKDGKKLIIGGGIANFTNVATTFKAIGFIFSSFIYFGKRRF